MFVETFFFERANGGGNFDLAIKNSADLNHPNNNSAGWQLLQDKDLGVSTAPDFNIDLSSTPFGGGAGDGLFAVQRYDIDNGTGSNDHDLNVSLEVARIWAYIDANPGTFPPTGA